MRTIEGTEVRAPRLPFACPVNVAHVRTVLTNQGAHYGAHAYVVTDRRGALVEVLSGDDTTPEARLYARWPWFGTQQSGALLLEPAWPTLYAEVSPREYRRLAGLEPWAGADLLRRADRCEAFWAVVEGLRRVRIDGHGRPNGPHEAMPAVIYHHESEPGGRELARALEAWEREGLARIAWRRPECSGAFATDRTPWALEVAA